MRTDVFRGFSGFHRRGPFPRLLAGGPLAGAPRRPARWARASSCSLVLVAGAGWYTSRPQFCNSCHIMEPYYKSWQESSHKDVVLHRVPLPARHRRQGPRQDARAGAVGQVRDQQRRPAAHRRNPRRQLPPLRLPRDPAADRPGGFPRHPLRPHPAPQGNPPRQAVPLHQLPQPDRAGAAHDGDDVDLLSLPFQGPAVQRGAWRLHALPPDPRRRSSTWAAA